ncbi:alpha/beta fold hydrolase [Roseovarius salis]|uniref:alpha/beta fold hydrolase n=1 Tax=Roseovarius salis TaxID=3376063 RepID=UPI0037CB3DB3
MLLLHGTSLAIDARVTWLRTIPALAGHHRVYALDMPGFGGTDAAQDGKHVQRPERCAFVRSFIETIGLERCAIVGHSEGAFIATRLGIETPDLVNALVIITSGATAPRLGTEQDAAWSAAAAVAYDVEGGCATEEDFVETIGRLSTTNPPDYLALLRKNYRDARKNGQFERLCASSTKGDYVSYTQVQEEWLFPFLSSIEARAMLIWAGADETVPIARGIKLLERLPDADMHILAGAAHMVMIDRPETFNSILLDFLSR